MIMIILWLLFINKILQLWKDFFLLKLIHIFSYFRIHARKFQLFIIMRALLDFVQKLWPFAKSWKSHDLNYMIIRNFVQNWFHIDTKLMRNFVRKKSFRAKTRNCCAWETAVSWKPYFEQSNELVPILPIKLIFNLLLCNNRRVHLWVQSFKDKKHKIVIRKSETN